MPKAGPAVVPRVSVALEQRAGLVEPREVVYRLGPVSGLIDFRIGDTDKVDGPGALLLCKLPLCKVVGDLETPAYLRRHENPSPGPSPSGPGIRFTYSNRDRALRGGSRSPDPFPVFPGNASPVLAPQTAIFQGFIERGPGRSPGARGRDEGSALSGPAEIHSVNIRLPAPGSCIAFFGECAIRPVDPVSHALVMGRQVEEGRVVMHLRDILTG